MEQSNKVVVGYCRVASFDETAMTKQERKLRLFAEEQGIGEIAFYSDNGYSGLNLDRPAFKRLEGDIKNGTVDVVITLDESRIARNLFLASDWMDKMDRAGIKLIFVNHPDNEVQNMIRRRLADAWRNDKKRGKIT